LRVIDSLEIRCQNAEREIRKLKKLLPDPT
jgi:hypothetical protein